jgi:hypothetical protein
MDTIKDKPNQEFFLRSEATFAAAGPGEGLRKFRGAAYGGGVITDHPMWDKVIFDLSTTRAPDRMPVLLEHDADRIVGYTGSVTIGDRVEVEGVLVDGEAGRNVAGLAGRGFPWQMSVRIMPAAAVQLGDRERTSVNGIEASGPATVFRDSLIREVGFCVLGADRDTEAVVFNMKDKEARTDTAKPTGQDRDPAIQALNDERDGLKAEMDGLKDRQAAFAAENAVLKGERKSLGFESRTFKTPLDAARKEADALMARNEAPMRAGRDAVLAEDFRRLGTGFSASGPDLRALPQAPEDAFGAARATQAKVAETGMAALKRAWGASGMNDREAFLAKTAVDAGKRVGLGRRERPRASRERPLAFTAACRASMAQPDGVRDALAAAYRRGCAFRDFRKSFGYGSIHGVGAPPDHHLENVFRTGVMGAAAGGGTWSFGRWTACSPATCSRRRRTPPRGRATGPWAG